ncbi:MAG: hypothetical protein KatS3mg022_3405 [Armatimonadota bacterium]|nr:MAG: hypothetical protein KatS3mg022_3405 [Armatimonadota bacterium]
MRPVRAFTLVEMLVVLAIIAVLVALLLGGIQLTRRHSNRTTCASNMRQLVIALKMYDEAWGGPPPLKVAFYSWDEVQPEIKPVLLCPNDYTRGEYWPHGAKRKPELVRTSYWFHFTHEILECSGWAPLPDSERIWFRCDWCIGRHRGVHAYADGHVAPEGPYEMDLSHEMAYRYKLEKACKGRPKTIAF